MNIPGYCCDVPQATNVKYTRPLLHQDVYKLYGYGFCCDSYSGTVVVKLAICMGHMRMAIERGTHFKREGNVLGM